MRFVLVLLTAFLVHCHGSRILAIFPAFSKSHKIAVMPIIEQLAKRGHEVTLITPFGSSKPVERIQEILLPNVADLMDVVDWFAVNRQNSEFHWNDVLVVPKQIRQVHEQFVKNFEELVAHPQVQHVMAANDTDFVFADGFFLEMSLPIIDRLRVPYAIHVSSSGLAIPFGIMGGLMDFALVPSALVPFTNRMGFSERMENMMRHLMYTFINEHFVFGPLEQAAKHHFPHLRPFEEIANEASLIVANNHPSTAWPRLLPPSIISAGYVHTRPAEPLVEPFKSFADESKDGFIVFTLGSIIHVDSMPKSVLQMFISVFARLPQRILWKWEGDNRPLDIPANVLLSKWIPQQDLLGHPNARLLLTHGGLLGIQETVYHGVPILGLPFSNDQPGNMAKVIKEGCGLALDWNTMDDTVLFDAITRLINEPEYKMNARRMSQLVRDELVPGVEVAAHWIEHVIRHGSNHLRMESMPLYQRYMLDVVLFLIIVCVVILSISMTAIRFVIRIATKPSTEKVKSN